MVLLDQFGGDLVRVLGMQMLKRDGEPAVQTDPPADAHLLVQRLAHERVDEVVALALDWL